MQTFNLDFYKSVYIDDLSKLPIFEYKENISIEQETIMFLCAGKLFVLSNVGNRLDYPGRDRIKINGCIYMERPI